jgi:hypothetical protein
MSKFYIYCSETVLYRVEVEADTAEDAQRYFDNNIPDLGEPYDATGFQIDEVVLAQETV